MAEKKELEVWVAWNEDGDYECGPDQEAAGDALSDNFGGYHRCMAKVKVTVTLPEPAEASVEIPEGAEATVTAEAAE